LAVLEEIFTRKDVAILTGGSGMFIKIVTDGLDEMPEADLELRESLMKRLETEGLESLSAQLRELDPVYFEEVDQQNPQRIVRALEVCLATGQPFRLFVKTKKERPLSVSESPLNDHGKNYTLVLIYEWIDAGARARRGGKKRFAIPRALCLKNSGLQRNI
jgi:tRNA A37 N6-isopentenylltransferase MiaA